MLIPKKNRVAVYSHLFKEGVMVAADEANARKHMELESVPNLQVIKLMQSLASRGYVRKSYTWNHYYWFLTNEGITYLREYLSLPEGVVPNTHKKQQARPSSRPMGDDRPGGDRGGGRFGDRPPRGDRPEGGGFGRGRGGDREGYRSGPKDPSSFGGDAPRFGGRGFGGGRGGGGGGGEGAPAGDRPRFGGRGRGGSDAPAAAAPTPQ